MKKSNLQALKNTFVQYCIGALGFDELLYGILDILKGQCHEIVCQLRLLTYSLGLDIAPRISFTL
jgi:hypothetical protein